MSYCWPRVVQPGGLRTTGRELKGKEHNLPPRAPRVCRLPQAVTLQGKKIKGNSHSNSRMGKSGGGF